MIVAELDPSADGIVVTTRRAARRVAQALGLSNQDQTRLAAAASEVAREAREQGVGPLTFTLREEALCIEVQGLRLVERGVGRLVDELHETDERVILEKRLTRGGPDEEELHAIRLELLTADPRAAAEEIRRQNAELLDALAEQRAAEEALRRSEERLRQALSATRLGTWEVENGTWLCSERCWEIFGVAPDDDPLRALDAEKRAEVEAAIDELRRTREPMELELEIREGVWVVLSAILEGGVVVGTALDVSERRRREEEARLRAELEQLLVGVVSHDIRSPLSTLKMGLRMLEDAGLEGEQRFVLERMTSAVGTANTLVHDLLDFTKARLGGGIPIDPQVIDGHALVATAIEDLRVAHPGTTVEHEERGAGRVLIDAHRLEQVVTNLVTNALRHSPEGSPVRVTTEDDGGSFHLRVQNEGPPIQPELLETIFEPLRQGADGEKRKGSLGLGLFIVKHVAEAHGGRVHVASSESDGTVFVMTLPLGTD